VWTIVTIASIATAAVSTSVISHFGVRQQAASKAEEEQEFGRRRSVSRHVNLSKSARRDFATVAKEAHCAKPSIYTTGREWGTVFAGLDRRSHCAICGSQGGRFSRDEQLPAEGRVARQEEAVMVRHNGSFDFGPNRQLSAMLSFTMRSLPPTRARGSGSAASAT
jgi:hypothetical protein